MQQLEVLHKLAQLSCHSDTFYESIFILSLEIRRELIRAILVSTGRLVIPCRTDLVRNASDDII